MTVDPRYQEQARAFVVETIKQVIPSANVDPGSALNSILARAAGAIGGVLHQEVDHLLKSRSITDPESISEQDMDLLLGNLLVSRNQGDLAFGFVRFYYPDRAFRSFAAGTQVSTEDGVTAFQTLIDLEYQPQDYLLDEETGEFFLSIPFSAVEPGDGYNVEVGEISLAVNDTTGATRVTNVSRFFNGRNRQTNSEALASAKRAVSTRSPLSRDGIVYTMDQAFGGKLRNLLVIGAGDPEMSRDEIYDMGPSSSPRFQIGKDGIGGSPQGAHVGGRTDCYLLFDGVNYVQQHVDIFADMIGAGPISPGQAVVTASIPTGAGGLVPAAGKLILDLGRGSEESVVYTSRSTVDNVTFSFALEQTTVTGHAAEFSVKVVNNGVLTVGVSGEITTLPVIKISEVRLLDPLTFQPIGSPIPEVSAGDRRPGWRIEDSNQFDIFSAKETKLIVIDEKRLAVGNQPLSGTASVSTVVVSGISYTQMSFPSGGLTGYQGREVSINGSVKTIVSVEDDQTVLLSGQPIAPGSYPFSIEAGFGDFNQYPVRVSYYTNTEIEEAQEIFDSDGKRTVCSDTLARSFMPMFLDFVMRYRGPGTPEQIRDSISEVLRTAAGEALNDGASASFDVSDLIAAAYDGGLANYVQTPFEIRVRRANYDGTTTTRYFQPQASTYGELAFRAQMSTGSRFIETRRPPQIQRFDVPPRGRLFLGGFTSRQETLSYDSVLIDGDNQTFILSEGQSLSFDHYQDESLKVSREDFDPSLVISDGVITDERVYRPFFGDVVVERIQ
jgi:hypothetical protein